MIEHPYDIWVEKIIDSKRLDKFKLFFDIYSNNEYEGILLYPKREYSKGYFNFNSLIITVKKISHNNNKDYGKPLLTFFQEDICTSQKIYKNIERLIKALAKLTSNNKLTPIVLVPPPYFV